MKKMLTVLIVLAVMVSFSFADQWTLQDIFYDFQMPRDDGYGIHGCVVDPDGNVWVGMYGNMAFDTLFTTEGDTIVLRPIWVFDATGNHVSFSPIRYAVTGGVTVDTLDNSCRGMGLAADGNILYSYYDEVYKFNYQTGEFMGTSGDLGGSLTEATADEDGNVYVSHVAGADAGIHKLSPDLSTYIDVCDSCGVNYNRTTTVSSDGQFIYLGSTWVGIGITVLESDLFGTYYTRVDTIGNVIVDDTTQLNLWPETLDWNLGVLWAGETDPAWSSHPRAGTWIGYNPSTGEMVDTLGIGMTVTPDTNASALAALGVTCNPRGMGSSADGKTLYVADFSTNVIQIWYNNNPVSLSIDDDSEGDAPIVALGYALHAAYPNPFNPVTTIEYEIGRTGDAKLQIFDLKGQLVRTLADGWHFHGKHTIEWDGTDNNGSRLASGTYIYRLSSTEVSLSKRITLLK